MTPCHNCPIQPSCTKKYSKPATCLHKPVLLPTHNISLNYANLGRKRIAFGGVNNAFRRMGRQENVLRNGMVEGWE